MEKLFIEASEDSPEILFDGNLGLLEIKGKSLPEDAIVCYSLLNKLVQEYVKKPKQNTAVNFRLLYLNSSSAKKILEIITLLENLPSQGFQVEIKWFYHAEDEDMLEEGEGFTRMTNLPISLVEEQ